MTPAYSDRLKRFACVLQRRDTDDFLAAARYTRKYQPGATQWFLLLAATREVQTPVGFEEREEADRTQRRTIRTRVRQWWAGEWTHPLTLRHKAVSTALDAQGMLVGSLHVMFYQEDEADRRRQSELLGRITSEIRSDQERTDADLDGLPDKLAGDIAANSFESVPLNFALFRTGEIRIWYDDEVAERLHKDDRNWIARQAYFFVKDMVHHHVHHDPKSDQITPLTETGNQPHDKAEEHWRRDTVWSMSRTVDALARNGKLLDLREATGILAYADAFQKTLLLYRRRAVDPASFEPNSVTYRYDYAHIRESLKVQIEQVSARRTFRAQMVVAGFAGSIAATSLVLSLISAYNGGIQDRLTTGRAVLPAIYEPLLRGFAAVPLVPALLCFLFLWTVSEFALSEEHIGARRSRARKPAQLIRGVLNSLAIGRQKDGAWVQSWIERFYLWLSAAIVIALLLAAPQVWQWGRAANDWLSSVSAAQNQQKTATGNSGPPPGPKKLDPAVTADPPQVGGGGGGGGGEGVEAPSNSGATAQGVQAKPGDPPKSVKRPDAATSAGGGPPPAQGASGSQDRSPNTERGR